VEPYASAEPIESSAPLPEEEHHPSWPGGGPAPAGALQRGFSGEPEPEPAGPFDARDDDESYIPRRGRGVGVRMLSRSLGGRIVLGCIALVIVGGAAIALAAVRSFALHNDRFLLASSDEIEVTGNAHMTRDQVLSVFGADLERNIFRMSLAERQADLERLPWVEHATVMRLLPNRIRVAITERTPVAFVRQGTNIGLVDAAGVLLDMPLQAAGDPKYSFPVLTGLSAAEPLEARAARMEVYLRFLHDLDSAGEHLTSQLSEVDVSNPEDVKALIAGNGADILVHFGDEDFLKRFHEFQQHLPEWRQQYPKLAAADMRYEGQVVLEMQQGAGVPTDNAANTDAAPATPAAPAHPSSAASKTAEKRSAARPKAKPAKAKARLKGRPSVGHAGGGR
jgi:cell division protein FtsQ